MTTATPTTPNRPTRLAYTARELAQSCGVSEQHIFNLIRRGELASFRLGRRYLIPATELDRLMDTTSNGRHMAVR